METRLMGMRVENLRGFTNAFLPLSNKIILLVGPNNSGKSGLLRLLHWAFSVDLACLRGERTLTPEEQFLLLPARTTRNSARRLVLRVAISDRRHKRFKSDESGIATLRFRLRRDRVFLNIGPPSRGEREQHDAAAVELLTLLRKQAPLLLIPPARQAASTNFQNVLASVLLAKMEERAVHRARGGAPAEYRTIKRAIGDIRATLEGLTAPIWDSVAEFLVPGMARTGGMTLDLDPKTLVEWAASITQLRVSTGLHDTYTVPPSELGSGVQSALEAGLMRLMPGRSEKDTVAIEEPEAYLHPSAQRTLARQLYRAAGGKTIIASHSNHFVDEAAYDSITIVKRHRIFSPTEPQSRNEINSALLTGLGAELVFNESVLFVEGEGDRLFFDALRRRLAVVDENGFCDRMLVVDCGSNTRFAPWMRLADSFRDETIRAIRWLVVADGCDSWGELTTALRATGRSLPVGLRSRIDSFNAANSKQDLQSIATATRRLNGGLQSARLAVTLIPHDLEWAILAAASTETVQELASEFQVSATTRSELMAALGSKAPLGLPRGRNKKPWIRAGIARRLPDDEISTDIARIIQRWLIGAAGVRQANSLLRSVGWLPPPRSSA